MAFGKASELGFWSAKHVKSTGCVLLGDHQGGTISVHQPEKYHIIMVILDCGDFMNRSQFTLPVMIIRSESELSKNMVESSSSVDEYCIVNFHSVQDGEVLFINNPGVYQFLSYLLMILYLNLKYQTIRVFDLH